MVHILQTDGKMDGFPLQQKENSNLSLQESITFHALHVDLPQLLRQQYRDWAPWSLTNEQVNKMLCLTLREGLHFIRPSNSIFHSHDKNAFSNLLFCLAA